MAAQQRYHPPYLRIAGPSIIYNAFAICSRLCSHTDIVLYFMFRIESSDHEEQRLFITTFCKHFMHRIDQHIESNHENQIDSNDKSVKSLNPSVVSPQSQSSKGVPANESLQNGHIESSQSPKYSINKTKDIFYGDDDVYNVIRYAPLPLVLSLFIPHLLSNIHMSPLKTVSGPFTNLISYINQVWYNSRWICVCP